MNIHARMEKALKGKVVTRILLLQAVGSLIDTAAYLSKFTGVEAISAETIRELRRVIDDGRLHNES